MLWDWSAARNKTVPYTRGFYRQDGSRAVGLAQHEHVDDDGAQSRCLAMYDC